MAQAPEPPSLMTIAPELRNAICELYLLNEIKEVHVSRSGAIANQPGLLTDLAPKLASRIVVRVHNFDFKPVMKFLDDLDVLDAEQRASVKGRMVMNVDLGEEQDIYVMAAVKGLLAWRAYPIKKSDGTPESKFAGYDKVYEYFRRQGYSALRSFFDTLSLRAGHMRRDKSFVRICCNTHDHRWNEAWTGWAWAQGAAASLDRRLLPRP
ncbi:hypothetical protein LTR17_004834 [Elasticomyces elasticus]|nr:hypothetical protein LTR17_004834 [Elasticomyces elasticus]